MNPILKNILAVIFGILIGGALNMIIIMFSGSIIAPPEGSDLTTMEGLKAAMAVMEPKHFILPFLAHALGTFLGALIAASMATNHKIKFALGIGVWFLIGGIINIIMLPSPTWFTFVDLTFAYIPVAYIAGKLIANRKESTHSKDIYLSK